MRYLSIFFIFISAVALGQDTLTVQGLNFNSTTRDTSLVFPTGDHNDYERILMYYTMRCKKGLISTGADRNRGCGEWDYSCNTSIIDSSGIDSILLKHPSVIIQGWSTDNIIFSYADGPTYSYYQNEIINTQVNNYSNEVLVSTGNDKNGDNSWMGSQTDNKYVFWISKEELAQVGTKINALRLKEIANAEGIDFMTVRIASTSKEDFSYTDFLNSNPMEVFSNKVTAATLSSGLLPFYQDYSYNSNNHLMVELAYTSSVKTENTLSVSTPTDAVSSFFHEGDDQFLRLSNNTIKLEPDDFSSVRNEITIAFWAYGETTIPYNNSIIYGVDAAGHRQVNIHLPWSNSRVFWDCGNPNGAGFDRIDKAILLDEIAGKWNHWVFTKNTTTSRMSIYLNGQLWHSANSKFKPIDLKQLIIGSQPNGNTPYIGGIDDVMLFDQELNMDEIREIMQFKVKSGHPLYTSMLVHHDFNRNDNQTLFDQSQNGLNGTIEGKAFFQKFKGQALFKDFTSQKSRINLDLIHATFTRNNSKSVVLDSIENFPYLVTPYSVEGTDLIKGETECYWMSGEMPIYDKEGTLVGTKEVPEADYFFPEELEYYRKSPSKYELLSFVTPYGIGIDFGLEGKTWIFDVTDFGPILKGSKRLLMDRGGEWQEEMDIQFKFIKGVPTRNVLSVQQIWPVDAVGYQNILNNTRFEPRDIPLRSDIGGAKLRVAITGHGQQGEFIPRKHWLTYQNKRVDWDVWSECAFNPIFPQGGTWVYDRAGWCPGAPTDLQEIEIFDDVKGNNTLRIDYGIRDGSGDSRYIVNTQLVQYGPLNFERDLAITHIKSPTSYVEFTRLNPACKEPVIAVKNNGSETIQSFEVTYGVEGTSPQKYTYNGSIAPLQEVDVTLPSFAEGNWYQGHTFYAKIANTNGQEDQYALNNELKSTYTLAPHLEGDITIRVMTNSVPQENKWYLRDDEGYVVFSETSPSAPNTSYTETFSGLKGCYTFQVTDSDHDGISWWANGDGNGSIRIKGENSDWVTLEPDFGGEISYSFTTGMLSNTENDRLESSQVKIFPNPTSGLMYTEDAENISKIELYDLNGVLIKSITNPSTEISVHDVMAGLYLTYIFNSNGTVSVQKIVIY